MMTIYHQFIDKGATFSYTHTVRTNAGAIRNISGYTGRAQLKRSYYTTTNTAFTTNVTSAAAGNIEISLTATQTGTLKPGRYVYDCELVHTLTGNVERVLEGIVIVTPEVTT